MQIQLLSWWFSEGHCLMNDCWKDLHLYPEALVPSVEFTPSLAPSVLLVEVVPLLPIAQMQFVLFWHCGGTYPGGCTALHLVFTDFWKSLHCSCYYLSSSKVPLLPVVLLFLYAQMQENPGNYSSSIKALHFFRCLFFSSGEIEEFDPSEESVEFSLAPSSRGNVQLVLLTPQFASTFFWKAMHCFCCFLLLGSVVLGELSVLFPLSLPPTQIQFVIFLFCGGINPGGSTALHLSLTDFSKFLHYWRYYFSVSLVPSFPVVLLFVEAQTQFVFV